MSESFRSRVILLFLLVLPLLALSGIRRPEAVEAAARPASAAPSRLTRAAQLLRPGTLSDRPKPRENIAQQAWFADARRQLGALGAVYMRLERWDGDCPVYQFRCDVQPASISPQGKTFEALSSSPRAATLHVLQAARRWHATTGDRTLLQAKSVRMASPPSRADLGALTPDRRTD